MAEIVNLRLARKAKHRDEAARQAAANRARMAAEGLISWRSILLIAALETPERVARSARDQLRASRSCLRWWAIWVSDLSDIVDICLL